MYIYVRTKLDIEDMRMHNQSGSFGSAVIAIINKFYGSLKKKSQSFTLTEILIALAVVAVISVLVLPVITTRAQNKAFQVSYEAHVKKILNSLDALPIAEDADSIDGTMMFTKNANLEDFTDTSGAYMKKYMKVAKYCGNVPGECFASHYVEYKNNNKAEYDITGIKGACSVLKNGVSICLRPAVQNDDNARLVSGYIDLNGKKGPNVFGRDLRSFTIDLKDSVVYSVENPDDVIVIQDTDNVAAPCDANDPNCDNYCTKHPITQYCCSEAKHTITGINDECCKFRSDDAKCVPPKTECQGDACPPDCTANVEDSRCCKLSSTYKASHSDYCCKFTPGDYSCCLKNIDTITDANHPCCKNNTFTSTNEGKKVCHTACTISPASEECCNEKLQKNTLEIADSSDYCCQYQPHKNENKKCCNWDYQNAFPETEVDEASGSGVNALSAEEKANIEAAIGCCNSKYKYGCCKNSTYFGQNKDICCTKDSSKRKNASTCCEYRPSSTITSSSDVCCAYEKINDKKVYTGYIKTKKVNKVNVQMEMSDGVSRTGACCNYKNAPNEISEYCCKNSKNLSDAEINACCDKYSTGVDFCTCKDSQGHLGTGTCNKKCCTAEPVEGDCIDICCKVFYGENYKNSITNTGLCSSACVNDASDDVKSECACIENPTGSKECCEKLMDTDQWENDNNKTKCCAINNFKTSNPTKCCKVLIDPTPTDISADLPSESDASSCCQAYYDAYKGILKQQGSGDLRPFKNRCCGKFNESGTSICTSTPPGVQECNGSYITYKKLTIQAKNGAISLVIDDNKLYSDSNLNNQPIITDPKNPFNGDDMYSYYDASQKNAFGVEASDYKIELYTATIDNKTVYIDQSFEGDSSYTYSGNLTNAMVGVMYQNRRIYYGPLATFGHKLCAELCTGTADWVTECCSTRLTYDDSWSDAVKENWISHCCQNDTIKDNNREECEDGYCYHADKFYDECCSYHADANGFKEPESSDKVLDKELWRKNCCMKEDNYKYDKNGRGVVSAADFGCCTWRLDNTTEGTKTGNFVGADKKITERTELDLCCTESLSVNEWAPQHYGYDDNGNKLTDSVCCLAQDALGESGSQQKTFGCCQARYDSEQNHSKEDYESCCNNDDDFNEKHKNDVCAPNPNPCDPAHINEGDNRVQCCSLAVNGEFTEASWGEEFGLDWAETCCGVNFNGMSKPGESFASLCCAKSKNNMKDFGKGIDGNNKEDYDGTDNWASTCCLLASGDFEYDNTNEANINKASYTYMPSGKDDPLHDVCCPKFKYSDNSEGTQDFYIYNPVLRKAIADGNFQPNSLQERNTNLIALDHVDESVCTSKDSDPGTCDAFMIECDIDSGLRAPANCKVSNAYEGNNKSITISVNGNSITKKANETFTVDNSSFIADANGVSTISFNGCSPISINNPFDLECENLGYACKSSMNVSCVKVGNVYKPTYKGKNYENYDTITDNNGCSSRFVCDKDGKAFSGYAYDFVGHFKNAVGCAADDDECFMSKIGGYDQFVKNFNNNGGYNTKLYETDYSDESHDYGFSFDPTAACGIIYFNNDSDKAYIKFFGSNPEDCCDGASFSTSNTGFCQLPDTQQCKQVPTNDQCNTKEDVERAIRNKRANDACCSIQKLHTVWYGNGKYFKDFVDACVPIYAEVLPGNTEYSLEKCLMYDEGGICRVDGNADLPDDLSNYYYTINGGNVTPESAEADGFYCCSDINNFIIREKSTGRIVGETTAGNESQGFSNNDMCWQSCNYKSELFNISDVRDGNRPGLYSPKCYNRHDITGECTESPVYGKHCTGLAYCNYFRCELSSALYAESYTTYDEDTHSWTTHSGGKSLQVPGAYWQDVYDYEKCQTPKPVIGSVVRTNPSSCSGGVETVQFGYLNLDYGPYSPLIPNYGTVNTAHCDDGGTAQVFGSVGSETIYPNALFHVDFDWFDKQKYDIGFYAIGQDGIKRMNLQNGAKAFKEAYIYSNTGEAIYSDKNMGYNLYTINSILKKPTYFDQGEACTNGNTIVESNSFDTPICYTEGYDNNAPNCILYFSNTPGNNFVYCRFLSRQVQGASCTTKCLNTGQCFSDGRAGVCTVDLQ